MSAITSDLLVINTEHQLKYLDANNAEITFGVQYDGMPQINTAVAPSITASSRFIRCMMPT